MASYSIIDLSNGSFKTYDDGIAPEEKIFWVPYTDAPELDKWDRFKLKIKSQKDDYQIKITLGFNNGGGETQFGNLQNTITINNWGALEKLPTKLEDAGLFGVEAEYDDADEAYILDLTNAYDGKGHHYTDGLYVNGKGYMDPGISLSDGKPNELVFLAYTEAPTTIPE